MMILIWFAAFFAALSLFGTNGSGFALASVVAAAVAVFADKHRDE